MYIGLRHKRIKGPKYDALVDEFMEAIYRRYPSLIISLSFTFLTLLFSVTRYSTVETASLYSDINNIGECEGVDCLQNRSSKVRRGTYKTKLCGYMNNGPVMGSWSPYP